MSASFSRLLPRAALPWVGIAVLLSALGASAAERGFPLITVYPAEMHKAGPQTFDIAQDRQGVLYFGNLHGLVIYDGAWWRLLELPDDQVALSLATDDKGRLAMGLVNDFGYLARDASGSPIYLSLLEQLPANERELGDIRDVCSTSAGFLYVAERSLILWDGTKASTVATAPQESAPRGCFAEGADILLRGPKGIHRFDPQTRQLTATAVVDPVQLILRRADGKLITVIRDKGVMLIDGDTLTPWAPEASAWLKGDFASGGARLQDGRLVITSRQHGLAILDANGGVEQILRDSAGLPDSVITAARGDREGSLWVSMEGPIVRVDVSSPVTVFDSRRGMKGGASDVARFDGRLFAASSFGLHTIDDAGHAKVVEGISGAAWRLLPVDGEMLITNAKGVWSMASRDAAPKLIVERDGELSDLHRSRVDPSRVWLAERYGVSALRRTAAGWQYEKVLSGTPQYISSVLEHEGVLWCGSVFNGIIRVDDPRGPKQRVQQFGDGEMNVFRLGGRPVFVRAKGEIVAIGAGGKLVPDPILGRISAPRGFFVLAEDARGNLWINSTPPRMFAKTGSGYAEEARTLVSVTAADIQVLRAHPDGVVWFASDKGLFRFDPSVATNVAATQPPPLIRRVVAGENRLLFGGVGGGAPVELRHDFGRVRLEFAPVSYRPGVEYQYRLDPIDPDWSEWTAQPFIDYTTLAANRYTFRLRARGASSAASDERHWSFSVAAPWYSTRWANLLWAILAITAIALIIWFRTAALRRQAETLRARVAEKTSELQETVKLLEQANTRLEALSLEDDLTGIANRRSFERALSEEWNRAKRHEHSLALILLDLDYFKDLNDRRGHPAGDDCLRKVGAFLAETIRRSGEVVARYGGEEFAILLPGVDADVAIRVAEVLRAGIEELGVPYGTGHRRVTASCGVAALVPVADLSAESLVASADRALYAAKHSGRNCVRVADETTTGTWLRDVSA